MEPDWLRIAYSTYHIVSYSAPPLGGPCRNIAITFGTGRTRWCGYPVVKKKIEDMFIRFDRIHECVRQTDRRTDTARRHRPRLCIASPCKINWRWIKPNLSFTGTPSFDVDYLRSGYSGILIGTYTLCPTQWCEFEWPWVSLSDRNIFKDT